MRSSQRAGSAYVYHILWEMFGGDADVAALHHTCENTWCVNPWHLRPLTPSEHASLHQAERNKKRTKDECVNGHSYNDPSNVGYGKRGNATERYCKACRKAYKQRVRSKKDLRTISKS